MCFWLLQPWRSHASWLASITFRPAEFLPKPLDRAESDALVDRIRERLAHEHWGNGYATEVARAALEFGLRDLGLDEAFTRQEIAPVTI